MISTKHPSGNDEHQAILFPAQQSGALIECLVTKTELEHLSGQSIASSQQALDIFAQYRFDLEELRRTGAKGPEFLCLRRSGK